MSLFETQSSTELAGKTIAKEVFKQLDFQKKSDAEKIEQLTKERDAQIHKNGLILTIAILTFAICSFILIYFFTYSKTAQIMNNYYNYHNQIKQERMITP